MATTLRGDDNFDSASPIPAGNFTAKAWVNFNGTGTVSIRDDGNVSSITDYGAGNYGVNFSTSLPSSNYATSVYPDGQTSDQYALVSQTAIYGSAQGGADPSTALFRFVTGNTNGQTKQDKQIIHVMAVL